MSKTKNLLSISGADFVGAGVSGAFWFILATLAQGSTPNTFFFQNF